MPLLSDREYLNYSDVLILPSDAPSDIQSRNDVNLTIDFLGHKVVPIIVSNMDHTGTIAMASAAQNYGLIVALHKFHERDLLISSFRDHLHPYHFISVGESQEDINKYQDVIQAVGKPIPLMVDVANGYRKSFIEYLYKLRKDYPQIYIAAGNICTPWIMLEYAEAGVDAIKVGIGPGGQCRTRETAGIGMPQFTAVLDCATAPGIDIDIIADGGINEYADFAKALGAGSKFVMAGSFFGGHIQCDGEIIQRNGQNFMTIYGMSSKTAQRKYYGEVKEYRASEGRTSLIPYKQSVDETINEILGSLRSTLTYINEPDISNINRAIFIKVNDTINRKYESHTIGI